MLTLLRRNIIFVVHITNQDSAYMLLVHRIIEQIKHSIDIQSQTNGIVSQPKAAIFHDFEDL